MTVLLSSQPVEPAVDRATSPALLESTPPQSAAPPQSMVYLKEVSKIYPGEGQALLDIHLNLPRGAFLLITGPSGAGKSTLLKLLYGEERPTRGEVWVDGQPVSRLRGDALAMLRRRIGVVFQDYRLIPRRTVAENIAFVLRAQGYSRQEIQRRLIPTLKMVGLQAKANAFPQQLSGGEQQRASIARAIVGTPPLLLADEPTGNLDPDNSWQIIRILHRLNQSGITIIVTTHDAQIIQRSGLPVVYLQQGRLQQG